MLLATNYVVTRDIFVFMGTSEKNHRPGMVIPFIIPLALLRKPRQEDTSSKSAKSKTRKTRREREIMQTRKESQVTGCGPDSVPVV